jgi:signal transduction histidine kinase
MIVHADPSAIRSLVVEAPPLGTDVEPHDAVMALRELAGELQASRTRIVEASDEARRRIERDLHDGAQQRLVGASLALASAMRAVDRGEAEHLPSLLARVREELEGGLAELRDLARGIHPAVLSDRGLRPAVDALAARSRIPVSVHGDVAQRPVPAVESALYFTVAEALTNVARYADASAVVVTIGSGEHHADVEIADDGLGGANPANGSGLRGLVDRLGALGGHLHVDSLPGAGTRVRAVVPLSPHQAEADVNCGCCAEGQCRCSA